MAYNWRSQAKRAIKQTLEKHFIFHEMSPYKCPYCKKWHIGKTNIIDYSKFEELIENNIGATLTDKEKQKDDTQLIYVLDLNLNGKIRVVWSESKKRITTALPWR